MLIDGYVRVSHVGGRGGERFISPAVQREKIEGWARMTATRVGTVFEELDESGARADRPLLLEAVRRVEAGESDGIVVAKLDRFGRSVLDGLNLIERIRRAGGKFVSVDDGFDISTDTGRLVLRVMLSMAEWELDRVRANWAAADERAVARGVWPGRAPTGYRRSKSGRLIVDERLGPEVSLLFKRRAEGVPIAVLADSLTDRGIRTARGNPCWVRATVVNILRNRIYLGEIHHGPNFKADAHEPLTDPATWARAQAPNERPAERPELPAALLRGMVRCASCRRVMSPAGTGRGSDTRAYKCSPRRSSGRCPAPASVTTPIVEPHVEAFFWQEACRKRRPVAPELDLIQSRVGELEDDLARYRDNARIQRTIGDDRFERGLAVRTARVERALAELAEARRAASPPGLPPLEQLRADWPCMTIDEKRALLLEVIECVFVHAAPGPPDPKLVVCLRGQAPVDLPRFGESGGGPARPLADGPPVRAATLRKRFGSRWSERRIERELAAFVDGRTDWPAFHEFQAAGLALLYRQITLTGGPRRWAPKLRLTRRTRPQRMDNWSEERVRRELTEFLRGRTSWPRIKDFRAAGRARLRAAVGLLGGGERWADKFGLPVARKQRAYAVWTDDRIEASLRQLIAGRNRWPTRSDFIAGGNPGLYGVIQKRGQREDWARKLGVPIPPRRHRPRDRWTEEEMEDALRDLIDEYGRWPTVAELKAAGMIGLYERMRTTKLKRNGWAEKLGAEPKYQHWTDKRIEQGLRRLINGRDTWPTVREFHAAGLAGLYSKLARDGLLDTWADRMKVTRNPRLPWTTERIRHALEDLLADRDADTFPTLTEFELAGQRKLYYAILKHPDGLDGWAKRSGKRRLTRRWTTERIEAALTKLLASREYWPSEREFAAAGLRCLPDAIRASEQGLAGWQARFGLQPKPTRRWSDEAIESALEDVLSGRQAWPTLSEFSASGYGWLAAAIRRHGGHDAWAQRFGLPRPTGRQRFTVQSHQRDPHSRPPLPPPN